MLSAMSKSPVRLPSPAPASPGSTVYVATDVRHERFIGVSRTLEEAQAQAEDDSEAIPYFSDGMTWSETDPIASTDPTRPYGMRQWLGRVVTDPHGLPREFRVVEHCLMTMPLAN